MKIKIREDIKPKHWIYCCLAVVCTILFSIWTGYVATLIFILLFIDIYITRIIGWNKWKQTKNKQLGKVLEWVDAIVFALIAVWFLNTFFFQNYQIPSSSLEKSLLVGDFLCVSKVSYGGRTPMTPFSLPLTQHTLPFTESVKSYLEKPQLKYKRLAGTGQITRNDIVVFNYPSGDTVCVRRQNEDYYKICFDEGRERVWHNKAKNGDIIYRPVDRRENYVKRCVGLPGEIIMISHDSVFIDGVYTRGSDNEQHKYVVQTDGTLLSQKLLSDIGVSDADFSDIQTQSFAHEDSTTLAGLGLAYKNGTGGTLHHFVNLTKGMIEELKSKSFVWNIVPKNTYYRELQNVTKQPNLDILVKDVIYPLGFFPDCKAGDFPELWLPKAGETITFDKDVEYKVATYERCIKNYEGNDFEYKNGKVYINGEIANSYTFNLDYYFMMGDNRDASADSRMWGMVPEDHIVGKPLFVWLSLNPDKGWFDGKIRWSRLFTSGNKK